VDSDHLVDLTDLQSCPTFFQQRVEKEFDVRITIVDDEINAMALFVKDSDGSQRCDVRRNNMEDVAYQTARLPAHVVQSIRSLMKHYRLRYGAIDMAVDRDGRWVFFEINPNGQWAWLDLAGGANIADLFLKSFSSAQK
jgi:regulator of PEP synthase PpsR (kinase-PPPase family)